jgi:MFS transporter, MHS family, proline/betaine transporter
MKSTERAIILPVTLGSLFEWFEIFLFIYWSKIFAESYKDLYGSLEELIYAILLLCTGLFARPIGGLLFGFIGDRWGRRIAFLISIVSITLPSAILTLMPDFPTWAYSSLIYLGIIRFVQGIPAGGELPGALCILLEGAEKKRRRYVCSYLFVGPQIGQILSVLTIAILEKSLSYEQLIGWGWRLSFGISSIIGIIGFFLRRKLHETKSFQHLKSEHRIEHKPLRESFKNHTKNIVKAFFLSIFEVTGFFVIYYYLFEHISDMFNIPYSYKYPLYLFYLIVLTILMPIIGSFNIKYSSRFFFKLSAFGVVLFTIPFYFVIDRNHFFWFLLILSILILLFCVQFSFMPSFIGEMFPAKVRFTCIGFSFNIADGVFGGMIPFLCEWLSRVTGKQANCVILLPIAGLIFLFALKFVKTKKEAYG